MDERLGLQESGLWALYVALGFFSLKIKGTSQYRYFWKCQDMKTISKPDWVRKRGFFNVCADF